MKPRKLYIVLAGLAIAVLIWAVLGSRGKLTRNNFFRIYNMIEKGGSNSDVESILGKPTSVGTVSEAEAARPSQTQQRELSAEEKVVTGIILVGHTDAGGGKLKIGDPAPAFSDLPGVDGKKHSLDEYKKDVLVVAITCNHCPVAVAYDLLKISLVSAWFALSQSSNVMASLPPSCMYQ